MPQFDVHRNPSAATREAIPYVVDIQSDLLSDLGTRLTLPLARAEHMPAVGPRSLCPIFPVDGESLLLLPHLAAAFRTRDLGRAVGSLSGHANAFATAIDVVFSGV